MLQKINDREVSIIQNLTERNWFEELPNQNWLCVIVDNDRPRRYLDELISKLLLKNVCYVCTIGQNSERNHDSIDEEIVFREADIDNLYLPKHHIMTTWDNEIEEGLWFVFFAAHHDEVLINKVIILDMTNGKEYKRIEKIINKL